MKGVFSLEHFFSFRDTPFLSGAGLRLTEKPLLKPQGSHPQKLWDGVDLVGKSLWFKQILFKLFNSYTDI